jgi:hypothetical protein
VGNLVASRRVFVGRSAELDVATATGDQHCAHQCDSGDWKLFRGGFV